MFKILLNGEQIAVNVYREQVREFLREQKSNRYLGVVIEPMPGEKRLGRVRHPKKGKRAGNRKPARLKSNL